MYKFKIKDILCSSWSCSLAVRHIQYDNKISVRYIIYTHTTYMWLGHFGGSHKLWSVSANRKLVAYHIIILHVNDIVNTYILHSNTHPDLIGNDWSSQKNTCYSTYNNTSYRFVYNQCIAGQPICLQLISTHCSSSTMSLQTTTCYNTRKSCSTWLIHLYLLTWFLYPFSTLWSLLACTDFNLYNLSVL